MLFKLCFRNPRESVETLRGCLGGGEERDTQALTQLQEASHGRLPSEETVPHSILSPLKINALSNITSVLPKTSSLQEPSPGLR